MKKSVPHVIRLLLIVVPMCVSFLGIAQNDVQISYFMANELAFNPSFAGANEGLQASVLARQQWVGFDKAPATQTLNVDYKSKIGGIGIYVLNDGLGYEWSTHAKLLYAYHIALAEHTQLSAGFGAGVYHKQLDASEFRYQNPITLDPEGMYATENSLQPTLDAGIHLSHKNLIVGISSTHITQAFKKSDFFMLPRHFYGYLQYQYDASQTISIVPTLYIKSGGYISQYEGNCNVYIKNKFWVGATYRDNESVVALAGIILKEKLKIGYAYDYSIGPIKPYSNGNHEIILSFRFVPEVIDKNYYQSTRLFN